MADERLINVPKYSDFDEDGNRKVDLQAGGADMDLSALTGILRVTGGEAYADSTMDHIREGTTYGRVRNSLLTSGRVTRLRGGANDLTAALGGSNRVLTLGANVALNQNLRITDSPTLNDLTISTPVNIYGLSHNSFAGYVANEHLPGIDEDDMASDSNVRVPTQQSVKAYVLALVAGAGVDEFIELTDTPASYDTADIGDFVRVKSDLSGLEFAPGAGGDSYVNREDPTVDWDQIHIDSNIDGQSDNHLIDSGADFINDGVVEGSWVYNATGALAYAQVTNVAAQDLTLDANIFPDDDADRYYVWTLKGNNVWTELDLSGIIDAGATLVKIRLHAKQSATSAIIQLRAKGETGVNWQSWKPGIVDLEFWHELLVVPDGSGIIECRMVEIKAPPKTAADYFDVTVVGWWV